MRLIVTMFLLLLTYCGQTDAALGDVYTVFGGGVVGGVTVGNSNGKLDGTGAAALMETPRGLAIIGDRLFIADTTNNIIRVGNLTSKVVTTLAGKDPDFKDGQGIDAAFKLPVSIVAAPGNDGPIYVLDQGNHAIRTVTLTGIVTTLVGNGTRGYTDGVGDQTQFSFTSNSGMVMSADGTKLYVCDTDNRRIRMIVIATKTVSTFSGTGTPGSTNGAATIATFLYPLQMASDGTSLYITDGQPAQTIRKIAIADGSVSSLNIGTPISLSSFTGIAVDTTSQTLYVADQGSFVIRSVPLTGGTITILSGKFNSSGVSDGAATVAGFSPQISALLIKNNVLYVADADNNKIRGINLVALSTDASLSSLQVYYLSNLVPLTFNAATLTYNLNVGIEMIRLSIKAAPTDPGASLSLRFIGAATPEFVPLTPNVQSQTYPITSGTASTNRFEIKVTAADGITSQTYVVDVKRPSSTGGNGAAATGASMIVAAVVAILTNMMLYM